MKMIETKSVVVIDVKEGDVFQYVKANGCRTIGELLVVKEVEEDGGVIFVSPHPIAGNYGSLNYLSGEMSAGNLIYTGTVTINSLEIK